MIKSQGVWGTYDCPDEVKQSFPFLKKSTKYTWKNNNVTFFYNDENCDEKIKYIVTLLDLIQPEHCPVHADILLSPVKKYFPKGNVFGVSNVNTGYTMGKKIVVFRKEEWFKVFIHECFHLFDFEKDLFDPSFTSRILKIFPVDSEVKVYESYCELWARRLNCQIISMHKKIPFDLLLEREKKHSMQHMVNVLKHMGLTYQDIQKPNSGFKEETSVLSYVVLANLMMQLSDYDLPEEKYVEFIEKNYNHPHFIHQVKHTIPTKTTTMSILSID